MPLATTKIWPVRDSLRRVVDYAANPDKTEYSGLAQALHYAENDSKTTLQETAQLVSGVHCRPGSARISNGMIEFMAYVRVAPYTKSGASTATVVKEMKGENNNK